MNNNNTRSCNSYRVSTSLMLPEEDEEEDVSLSPLPPSSLSAFSSPSNVINNNEADETAVATSSPLFLRPTMHHYDEQLEDVSLSDITCTTTMSWDEETGACRQHQYCDI